MRGEWGRGQWKLLGMHGCVEALEVRGERVPQKQNHLKLSSGTAEALWPAPSGPRGAVETPSLQGQLLVGGEPPCGLTGPRMAEGKGLKEGGGPRG